MDSRGRLPGTGKMRHGASPGSAGEARQPKRSPRLPRIASRIDGTVPRTLQPSPDWLTSYMPSTEHCVVHLRSSSTVKTRMG
ncbi:hypothetical protein K437DRAFT_255508 [Tilletiaria anomala UBC 951]|uniref:Uncharacterized protein n=1 Tax=Tilletiaria anomala (strain ATCC 24038 / CBS 436.72 / UBC 951) TaxID=1037660 RepID=A0A066W3I8_TILAU|nr:uncharacterized protein K437DRAFT_255508 [Tilletiaria anomala UBC 951]KDN48532.1 hypothetical protein K437DRAFT_255508 [Tilletiaria anomala UBC 951]